MPSPAKRSQRNRRDTRKAATASTPPADMEDSSPSRPAKRRRKMDSSDGTVTSPARSTAAAGRSAAAHSNDDEVSPESNDDQLVSQVTQQLKSQPVKASKDHANSIHEANGDGVKAYAKVSAMDWTFYITKLAVNIGREPEVAQTQSRPGRGGRGGDDDDDQDDPDYVHIDLGPGKMVSREHAAISFDSKNEKWCLHVKGRNGAKVDGVQVKAGASHALTSGEVIEIGNVEMMFVLPLEICPLQVHPDFLERAGIKDRSKRPGSSRGRRALLPAPPREPERPGTPPSTQRSAATNGKSPAVATPAVMIGPNGVDLSLDENQHIKPQYSYAQMITQAILNATDGKLNLNGIYNFIMDSYSYYRHQQAAGWQNSIRHNLSLNRAFDKVARSTDEPGKGMKWQLVPEAKEDMVRNAFRIGRGGHRGSSAPSSPSQLNYITHGPRDMATREPSSARKAGHGSPLVSPPPRSSIHFGSLVQSTPDRRPSGRTGSMLTADGSPLPRSRKLTPAAKTESSAPSSSYPPQSPTLTSSYLQDDGGSFVTPAPPRVHPKLAPPSTAQRPSQHMPTSSPAPFWRYADIGSTPMKPMAPYELSPIKPSGEVVAPQSSSPPARAASSAAANKSPPSSPTRPQRAYAQMQRELEPPQEEDEEDEQQQEPEEQDQGGFDLTKGFQSIGSYHAPTGLAGR